MKKREFIEMGLKAFAAIMAAFLAIILMEGMIYGIELNALKTAGKGHVTFSNSTIAYCIKEDDDKYFVVYYNPENTEKQWSATKDNFKTKAECLAMEGSTVKEVVMHAPMLLYSLSHLFIMLLWQCLFQQLQVSSFINSLL